MRTQNFPIKEAFLTLLYAHVSRRSSGQEISLVYIMYTLLWFYLYWTIFRTYFVTRDFNARCPTWWKNDITTTPDQEIDSLTSLSGYAQIIDKSTYVVNNSMSCVDLIFCTNKNITLNHEVDVTIFKKYHYKIICGKINIRVPLPSVYIREVWD